LGSRNNRWTACLYDDRQDFLSVAVSSHTPSLSAGCIAEDPATAESLVQMINPVTADGLVPAEAPEALFVVRRPQLFLIFLAPFYKIFSYPGDFTFTFYFLLIFYLVLLFLYVFLKKILSLRCTWRFAFRRSTRQRRRRTSRCAASGSMPRSTRRCSHGWQA
jgi:hypothetical protein